METIKIWGIKISTHSKKEIVSSVLEWLDAGKKGIHITGVNPETIVLAQNEPILREAILDSDIVNIDNTLVLLRLRTYGIHVSERAATPDVFFALLDEAEKRGESVYFLGAEQAVLEKMIKNVRAVHPNLMIAGYRNGFYSAEEEPAIIEQIKAAHPTYLYLGLPSPKKESFIMNNKKNLGVGVLYGVGGAFDVLGEKVKRAPDWLGRIGLEGVVRVIQNPSNYGCRVLKYYPLFFRLKK